jgi:hypothetical protein
METAKVMNWLSMMDSSGEPCFCLRRSTIATANSTPLPTAIRFPHSPPAESLSRKNRAMPPRVTAMATQSCQCARSPRIGAASSAA